MDSMNKFEYKEIFLRNFIQCRLLNRPHRRIWLSFIISEMSKKNLFSNASIEKAIFIYLLLDAKDFFSFFFFFFFSFAIWTKNARRLIYQW